MKAINILLAAVTIVAIILCSTSPDIDGSETDIVVSSQIDDYVDVFIDMKSNPGVWCISMPVSYDDRFELLEVTKGIIALTPGPTTNNPYTIYGENDDIKDVTATGTLAKLRFKAPAGVSGLWVSIGDVEAFNVNGEAINISSPEGKTYVPSDLAVHVKGVSLDEHYKALSVGETFALKASVSPSDATDKGIRWSSDRPAVASVSSNGTVNALSKGTAIITVETNDGNYKDSCTVSISEIEATGVTLDKSSLKLAVGESYALSATVLPANATDKSVKWESNNASVATVSEGKVVAISEGKATITATTANGKEAACSVTVEKAPETVVRVTGITLDKASLILDKGSSATLTATVLPANATDKGVVWSTSDSKVATVSNGKVTATGPGDATITVTTSDGGRTATCKITVPDPIIKVTSVSLDKASLSLSKGDTAKLTATVLPPNATDKGVVWSTSDSGIATVSSAGTVNAISPGTTTVKATTSNGGYIATCSVTVVEEPSPSSDNTLLYVGIAAAIVIAVIAALALRKR